jgi:AmmeMemoRadiSam system protein B
MAVRRTAVAGTWYPGTAGGLRQQVRSFVEDARRDSTSQGNIPRDADVVALIAPHAGLVYSGGVAAYAYALIASRHYDRVILVGPSHYVGFDGASVWAEGAFETPAGNLAIDTPAAKQLQQASSVVIVYPEAHRREHSLELQLPFLSQLAPETPIVPIVMGFQTRDTAFAVGDAVAAAARNGRTLLVASSDLSHFYDADTAVQLDTAVIDRIDALDDEGLMSLLERRPDHACGGGPIVAVIRAAKQLGGNRARVLRYGDSGDISGDKSSVVGYLAAAVWRA